MALGQQGSSISLEETHGYFQPGIENWQVMAEEGPLDISKSALTF